MRVHPKCNWRPTFNFCSGWGRRKFPLLSCRIPQVQCLPVKDNGSIFRMLIKEPAFPLLFCFFFYFGNFQKFMLMLRRGNLSSRYTHRGGEPSLTNKSGKLGGQSHHIPGLLMPIVGRFTALLSLIFDSSALRAFICDAPPLAPVDATVFVTFRHLFAKSNEFAVSLRL